MYTCSIRCQLPPELLAPTALQNSQHNKNKNNMSNHNNNNNELELFSVIGFGGTVTGGLHVHPDQQTIIYPLGSTLVIKSIHDTFRNEFLHGHDKGPISCVALSKSGRYIASGQSTHMGFKADIIIWDYETRSLLHRMTLHKVKVQALSFSENERYLASIGGQDDNNVTIWDVSTGKPVCGAVSPNLGHCLSFFHGDDRYLVTGGRYLLRVWEIDYDARKLTPTDCRMGQLKRIVTCLVVDEDDQYAYCGTTSGDVLCVQVQGPKNFKFSGPKAPITKGIVSIFYNGSTLIVGGGDGSLNVLNKSNLLKITSKKLLGGVTSISPIGNTGGYVCGTTESVIYQITNSRDLEAILISTCHNERINDMAYPMGSSEIVATCSMSDIRLWNVMKGRELLRIRVDNLECNCVCFSPSGKSIISGWSDGRIRSFGPQSGKLLFVINDAHKITGARKISGALIGVTALAMTSDGSRIVSGGSDGQVRVWNVGGSSQTLIAMMKEHKATVNCIAIKNNNSQCVTASDDGSCIVWNLDKFIRQGIMYAQTYFKQAKYLNDESQILTCGSDKQITYWDAYDCSAIREMRESEKSEINALDIAQDGEYFASGGLEKHVNVWNYDEGVVVKSGVGHSGAITKIRFSPDSKYICSVGSEGAIFIWYYRV